MDGWSPSAESLRERADACDLGAGDGCKAGLFSPQAVAHGSTQRVVGRQRYIRRRSAGQPLSHAITVYTDSPSLHQPTSCFDSMEHADTERWVPGQERQPDMLDLRYAATGPKGYKINPVKSKKRRLAELLPQAGEDGEAVEAMDEDEDLPEQAPKRQKDTATTHRPVRHSGLCVEALCAMCGGTSANHTQALSAQPRPGWTLCQQPHTSNVVHCPGVLLASYPHTIHTRPHKQVSGKTWKAKSERAAIVMKPKVGLSWEKRMQKKAVRQNFVAVKKEALESHRATRKVGGRVGGQAGGWAPPPRTTTALTSTLLLLPAHDQAEAQRRKEIKERKKANQQKSGTVVQKVRQPAEVTKTVCTFTNWHTHTHTRCTHPYAPKTTRKPVACRFQMLPLSRR